MSASGKMLSVLEVVRSSTEYLQKRGVESARLNAEFLVAHILGKKQRIDLYLEFDRPIGATELDPLRELIRRRGKGEPLQHLLGTVEFHGREFLVDARALIPRPETEQFAELLLKLDLAPNSRCADVGTGSGVLALTLAAERPEFIIFGIDLSLPALTLAKENADRLGLADRVLFSQGDLLESVESRLELIAANLPYIGTEELAGLSREVKCDPLMALDGGPGGLDIIRRLIVQAREKLLPGGAIALENGCDQAEKVVKLLTEAGFEKARSAPDHQGIARFVSAYQPTE